MDATVSSYTTIYRPPIKDSRITQGSRTIFTDDIEDHLYKANTLARKVLGNKRRGFSGPSLGSGFCGGVFNFRIFSFSFWTGGGSRRSDGRGEALLIAIGVIVVAIGFFGKNLGKLYDTHHHLKGNKDVKEHIDDLEAPHHVHVSKIRNIIKDYTKLLKSRYKNFAINCALSITAVAGGILLAVGAIYALTAMMVVGGTLVLAASAGAIFKYCFNVNRKVNPDMERARRINSTWKSLKMEKTMKNPTPTKKRTNHPIALTPVDKKALEEKGFKLAEE
jgi:uncharacterized membrane protein YphA (DoxX/SURF4 family)